MNHIRPYGSETVMFSILPPTVQHSRCEQFSHVTLGFTDCCQSCSVYIISYLLTYMVLDSAGMSVVLLTGILVVDLLDTVTSALKLGQPSSKKNRCKCKAFGDLMSEITWTSICQILLVLLLGPGKWRHTYLIDDWNAAHILKNELTVLLQLSLESGL